MSAQTVVHLMRKSFQAPTARGARQAASAWLGDFSAHGPLDIRSIRLVEEPDSFSSVVTFSEMPIDEAPPRYFSNIVPLLKSA